MAYMDSEFYNSYEEFSRYLYEHPFGVMDELKEKFGSQRVNQHLAMGFMNETIFSNYTLTKRGKEFLDLKYKPLTLWERLVDFWYFKILKVKLKLN